MTWICWGQESFDPPFSFTVLIPLPARVRKRTHEYQLCLSPSYDWNMLWIGVLCPTSTHNKLQYDLNPYDRECLYWARILKPFSVQVHTFDKAFRRRCVHFQVVVSPFSCTVNMKKKKKLMSNRSISFSTFESSGCRWSAYLTAPPPHLPDLGDLGQHDHTHVRFSSSEPPRRAR